MTLSLILLLLHHQRTAVLILQHHYNVSKQSSDEAMINLKGLVDFQPTIFYGMIRKSVKIFFSSRLQLVTSVLYQPMLEIAPYMCNSLVINPPHCYENLTNTLYRNRFLSYPVQFISTGSSLCATCL